MIRKDILSEATISRWMDNEGCLVVVKCILKGQLYTLVSVYIPQRDARPLEELR